MLKMAQKQPLNIANTKSQKTLIWDMKEIQKLNVLKKV